MGVVTEYLINLIAKQVEDNRLVVWFDPERHYGEVARNLSLPGTTAACYEGSFFALRREVDPLLEGLEPPRLVVYVPMAEEESHSALVELTAAGVVMKPGQNPWQRNTRLSVIARNALKPVLGDDAVTSIEKQVEAGQLSLEELDKLAGGGGAGVISVLFGTSDPRDVALTFLGAENASRLYQEIVKRNAMAELASLLYDAFEAKLPAEQGPESCRAQLARHILATAFVTEISGDVPHPLATLMVATGETARQACLQVAKTWRSRRDMRESYVEWAGKVEKDLGMAEISFTREQLSRTETFLALERALQEAVEKELVSGANLDLVELARRRQSGFWAEQVPEMQARWAFIATVGQLLAEADRVESEIKSEGAGAAELVRSYTSGERPWCLLDTYHRHMERLYQNLDFPSDRSFEALEKLVIRARQRYARVGDELAQRFSTALRDAKFKISGVLRQVEVYSSQVAPVIEEGKVAYVLVDALRFDMARELVSGFSSDFDIELKPAMAAVPTITEVGMAALMPRADQGATLVPADKGKLALRIGEAVLKDRASRVKWFAEMAGVPVLETKLDNLLGNPNKKTRAAIKAARLILVTSQEIDDICEDGNILLARRIMDDISYLLQKACRALVGLGVQTIVIAADHGYLFGEEVESDMKIDPPGGETLDLHRRVWVGRGGSSNPAFLRARASDFGLGRQHYGVERDMRPGQDSDFSHGGDSDLEVAVPFGFGVFKVAGGSRAYFHGGLSLQELIIPVIRLTAKAHLGVSAYKDIHWELAPGSKKISTRFFSVQIHGSAVGLFEVTLPKVRVEIHAGKGVVSRPVSASYGFDESTGAVEMRMEQDKEREVEPNTVTLMLTGEPSQKTATVCLLDALSGRELARIDGIEVTIAI